MPEANKNSSACSCNGGTTQFKTLATTLSSAILASTSSPWSPSAVLQNFFMAITPWRYPGPLLKVQSNPWIAAFLNAIMLEEHPGRHHEMAGRLCGLSGGAGFTDALVLHLFLLSNNFLHWKIVDHDKQILGMLDELALNKISFQTLFAVQNITAAAIMEKVFPTILRSKDLNYLRIFLEAGVDPNTAPSLEYHVSFKLGDRQCPLDFAAGIKDHNLSCKIAHLLISHGAKVNKEGVEALMIAVRMANRELARVLISAGAHFDQAMLSNIFKRDRIHGTTHFTQC
ncbi:hypothetical protein B0T25DRAFT_117468 [Lasiosphaeria hispida]|uniref:Ankyrin repeat protein n=1 Tax=Lasiosphaeria hispida TaxID=260671 RepID=A0AAJ0MI77_9PEZI|nr:hypothetical protein B0T25DRAFT_117468 [Lasiosphaeria hispida]